ncbi:MAG: DUF3786 domain-containing protein [Faecousia sp.]
MERRDNYAMQAEKAKESFLHYDQEALIRKFGLRADENYLYPVMLSDTYRLSRTTGDLSRQAGDTWVDANTHGEVMTLLDLLCDSREDRFLTGSWKSMQAFGNQIHRNLLERPRDAAAERFAQNMDRFEGACRSLGGTPVPMGDMGFAIELFDGLKIAVALWREDEDFPAALRYYWDENALMYIRYETMYYAVDLLRSRLKARM